MYRVAIRNYKCLAIVGVYPQEQILKNELLIDAWVSQKADINKLPMIDYVSLKTIVDEIVKQAHQLLEEILQKIINAIIAQYPNAEITVRVKKLHPAFGGEAAASVSYTHKPA